MHVRNIRFHLRATIGVPTIFPSPVTGSCAFRDTPRISRQQTAARRERDNHPPPQKQCEKETAVSFFHTFNPLRLRFLLCVICVPQSHSIDDAEETEKRLCACRSSLFDPPQTTTPFSCFSLSPFVRFLAMRWCENWTTHVLSLIPSPSSALRPIVRRISRGNNVEPCKILLCLVVAHPSCFRVHFVHGCLSVSVYRLLLFGVQRRSIVRERESEAWRKILGESRVQHHSCARALWFFSERERFIAFPTVVVQKKNLLVCFLYLCLFLCVCLFFYLVP